MCYSLLPCIRYGKAVRTERTERVPYTLRQVAAGATHRTSRHATATHAHSSTVREGVSAVEPLAPVGGPFSGVCVCVCVCVEKNSISITLTNTHAYSMSIGLVEAERENGDYITRNGEWTTERPRANCPLRPHLIHRWGAPLSSACGLLLL